MYIPVLFPITAYNFEVTQKTVTLKHLNYTVRVYNIFLFSAPNKILNLLDQIELAFKKQCSVANVHEEEIKNYEKFLLDIGLHTYLIVIFLSCIK